MKTNTKVPKTPFFAAFSVGAVLFSAHAGGGFATGNQANTYYVGLGWTGIISAIAAMLLLTLTMREAMIMYNSRGLTSYKQLFETLYHPFDKIEWAFEVFFYIMVLMAVAAAISGAASALNNYFTINYYIGVAIVGVIVLMLTIFGAGIVRAASTYMGMAILVTAISIYVIGIFKSDSSIFSVLAADFETTGFMNMPKAILNAFTYAGFQCVTLPTMIACGTTMNQPGTDYTSNTCQLVEGSCYQHASTLCHQQIGKKRHRCVAVQLVTLLLKLLCLCLNILPSIIQSGLYCIL